MPIERRRSQRQAMCLEAMIFDLEGSMVGPCTMLNISVSGAKLIPQVEAEVPDCFLLVLSKKGGVRRHCEVTWRSDAGMGVRFVSPVAAEDEAIGGRPLVTA